MACVLGSINVAQLLVMTSDLETLEFGLLNKQRRRLRGPVNLQQIQVVPLSLIVAQMAVGIRQLRTVRCFPWIDRDGLQQFDKLSGVFEAKAFSENYFFTVS